jgi:hypothetical protein
LENTSEFYYEKLKNSVSPGPVLAGLYCSLYDFSPTKSEIILMNRLVKVFGRFTLFFSIIDMAGSYPEKVENPYGLLFKICKNKFENNHRDSLFQSHEPLDKFIGGVQKEIEQLKKSKLKIPPSKGLENNG